MPAIIQGIGGGVLPLAFGIIRDEFPHHKVGGAVSVVSSLLAVGFGAGIVLAGPIVSGSATTGCSGCRSS